MASATSSGFATNTGAKWPRLLRAAHFSAIARRLSGPEGRGWVPAETAHGYPFRPLVSHKPDGRIRQRMALPGHHRSAHPLQLLTNDLYRNVLHFPTGHFDAFVGYKAYRIERNSRAHIDEATAREVRLPLKAHPTHRHQTPVTLATVGNARKPQTIARHIQPSVRILDADKE